MEHPRIYAGVDTHSDTHTLALIGRVWQAVGHADVHGRSDRLRKAGRHDRRSRCLSGRRGGRHQLVRGGAHQAARRGRVRRTRGTPAQTLGATQGRQVRSRRRTRRGPAACSRATGPVCRRARMGGSRRYAPERGNGRSGHRDDRAVQPLREGPADHRPGTHPGTYPGCAPRPGAQTRRMASEPERGGAACSLR